MENEIINRMGFMMEQALATMTGTLADAFKAKGIDLPHSQYIVLRLLYQSETPLTQIKIADILKKDAAAIKRTVDILERKGLVIREPQNGRTNKVVCTEKAIAIKDTVTETANDTLHRLLGRFSETELKGFLNILCSISASENLMQPDSD